MTNIYSVFLHLSLEKGLLCLCQCQYHCQPPVAQVRFPINVCFPYLFLGRQSINKIGVTSESRCWKQVWFYFSIFPNSPRSCRVIQQWCKFLTTLSNIPCCISKKIFLNRIQLSDLLRDILSWKITLNCTILHPSVSCQRNKSPGAENMMDALIANKFNQQRNPSLHVYNPLASLLARLNYLTTLYKIS